MGDGNATITSTVIANMALAHLRQTNFLTDINADVSEQAIVARQFYDADRRKVLRECDWTFARKYVVSLTLLGDINTATSNPTVQKDQDIIPGWIWTFAQPPKCLAIRKIFNPLYGDFPDVLVDPFRDLTTPIRFLKDSEYTLGRSPVTDQLAIGCNLQNAGAFYTFDETDTSRFDDHFVRALALQLAVDMAMPLSANPELLQLIEQRYERAIGEAKRINHQEETEKAPRASEYLDVRNA